MKLVNVSKTYHNKANTTLALDDINLEISTSGMHFIVGPSGCGKTTLLNIIAGLDTSYDGIVEIKGIVEYLTQETMLFENLSVLDNLLIVSDDRDKISELLGMYHIINPLQKVKYLSVGEKRRVQILRSFLSDASYLVCDEPTASLDYDNQLLVMDALKDLSKEKCVIVVTHQIALVEQYSDRTIMMGKACIKKDISYNASETHTYFSFNYRKKVSHHISYLIKKMNSRKAETIFQICILFSFIFLVYLGTFFYGNLSESNLNTMRWINAKNVIVTQPIASLNENSPNPINPDLFYEYDLYHLDDLETVEQNIDGIVASRIGWDIEKFDTSPYGCSYIPRETLEDIIPLLEKYEKEYLETQVEPFPLYSMLYDLYKKGTHLENVFSNYSNYRGLHLEDDGMVYKPIPHMYFIRTERGMDVVPYQLFENASLELMYGTMPSSDNEIVLSKNLALTLQKERQLNSIYELIGDTVEITFGYFKKDVIDVLVLENNRVEFVISGITYAYSDYENQLFFRDGAYLNLLEELCLFDASVATYQYMTFLIDPTYDENLVADQLNHLLKSQKSEFIPYAQIELQLEESYHNPWVMRGFIVFGFMAVCIIIICKAIILRTRTKKENLLLNRYGYSLIRLDLLETSFLSTIVFMIQMAILPLLCDKLNLLANSLGVSNIVYYDAKQFIQIYAGIFLVILLVRGVLYAFRTKKYLKKI